MKNEQIWNDFVAHITCAPKTNAQPRDYTEDNKEHSNGPVEENTEPAAIVAVPVNKLA